MLGAYEKEKLLAKKRKIPQKWYELTPFLIFKFVFVWGGWGAHQALLYTFFYCAHSHCWWVLVDHMQYWESWTGLGNVHGQWFKSYALSWTFLNYSYFKTESPKILCCVGLMQSSLWVLYLSNLSYNIQCTKALRKFNNHMDQRNTNTTKLPLVSSTQLCPLYCIIKIKNMCIW